MLVEEGRTPLNSSFMLTAFQATFFSLAITTASILDKINAATIEARSVSFGDVDSAIRSAKDGDTISVPAGRAVWTTPLEIDKNITVRGAGATSTVIVDEVGAELSKQQVKAEMDARKNRSFGRRGRQHGVRSARGLGNGFLIRVSLKKNLPFRLTGFGFIGGALRAGKGNGIIRINGVSHAFRIDHCTFDHLRGLNLVLRGFLWGVVDHCLFKLDRQQPMQIYHESWNEADHGNGSWADDPYWGSEKFIFIEDNVFDNSEGKRRSIDSYEGARFVVRYNRFHNSDVSMHGTEGQGRGAKQLEEYNNTFVNDTAMAAAQIRSGVVITHGNTYTNVPYGHVLQVYRPFAYSPHWNWANGQNAYDDNAPNGTTGYWVKGSHTGADGATTLTDACKSWAINQWYQPGAVFIVRNKTKEAAATTDKNKVQSFAISNTSNTITFSQLVNETIVHLTFNKGDVYEIWNVKHCLDQPGLGKGDLLKGLPGIPARWPNEVSEPCYSWNNNSADGDGINLKSTVPCVKDGRDFFNNTPKPGYKPFTYPHPFVQEWPPRPSAEGGREAAN
jgi:hypothetical protein